MKRFARPDALWLAGILLVAFAVRLAWVLYAQVDPLDGRFADTVVYHLIAASMAEGGGYTSPYTLLPTALFPPGYISFLIPIYWAFGAHYELAELANVFLGTASVGLLYVIALQLFGVGPARLAALLLAVFPGQVFFTSLIYSEPLYTLLMLAGLIVLIAARRRSLDWRWVVLYGIVAGAATMVRSSGAAMLVMGPLYLLLLTRDVRGAARATVLMAAGAALLIGPWTVRNIITLDSPVVITTAAGINLYQGHHVGASGGDVSPAKLIYTYGLVNRAGGEVDVNNAGVKEAVHFAATHPLSEVALVGKKLRELYAGDSGWLDLNEDYGHYPFIEPDLRDALRTTADVYYFALLAAAGLGVLRWSRERGAGPLLPVVVILVWSGAHVVTFGAPRYHVPVMPLFCLLAAYGLAWLPGLAAGAGRRANVVDS